TKEWVLLRLWLRPYRRLRVLPCKVCQNPLPGCIGNVTILPVTEIALYSSSVADTAPCRGWSRVRTSSAVTAAAIAIDDGETLRSIWPDLSWGRPADVL